MVKDVIHLIDETSGRGKKTNLLVVDDVIH